MKHPPLVVPLFSSVKRSASLPLQARPGLPPCPARAGPAQLPAQQQVVVVGPAVQQAYRLAPLPRLGLAVLLAVPLDGHKAGAPRTARAGGSAGVPGRSAGRRGGTGGTIGVLLGAMRCGAPVPHAPVPHAPRRPSLPAAAHLPASREGMYTSMGTRSICDSTSSSGSPPQKAGDRMRLQ